MLRLFFAVQTPPQLVEELQQVQNDLVKKLEGLKPTPNFKRENLANSHCTIRFLGDVEEDQVDRLVEKVGEIIETAKIPPFEMSLTECGSFSHRGKTRVIWVGLEPVTVLQHLQERTDSGVLGAALKLKQENEFHPHLTLIRFRETYRPPPDFTFPAVASASGNVNELLLVSSKTLPQGAQHEVIHRFPLSG
jgi:2'-5' RNA ligase